MKLEALLHFYRQRFRTHPAQELLAGAGIAIGVALVFAVIVANTSITTSASQISRGIAGHARLQLGARGEQGFDAGLLQVVRSLPSVEHASGIFEQRAILQGTHRTTGVALIGVDASLALLGGPLTQNFGSERSGLIFRDGLLVPSGLASSIGIGTARPGQDRTVTLRLRGSADRVPVAAVIGKDVIGKLSGALVVVGRREYINRLAGLPGRLTRIFVEPRPGQDEQARRQLEAIARDRLTVAPVSRESRILAQASAPNDQSTQLFAAISAVVGLLLAFNAMLLTVPERRRAIAEFRTHGYTPRQIVLMAGFDALVLGGVASAVGLGAGLVLSRTAFDGLPTYLAFAFPFGAEQTVPTSTVVLCFLGGVLATFLAAVQPLLDLRPSRASDAVHREEGEPGQGLGPGTRRRMGVVSLLLLLATSVVVSVAPSATILGVVLLALSMLFALPVLLAVVMGVAERIAWRRPRLNMLAVAVMSMRATRVRAIALAATGAVAVFGSVSIEGAHRDLVDGLHRNFVENNSTADLWVTTGGDDLTTENFLPGDTEERIRRAPGVAAVRSYYGGLLDIGERRVWVIGRSRSDRRMLPAGQLEAGSATQADLALRRGGAVAISAQLADATGVRVGETLAIPTPTGNHGYRVVATLTNLGWGPGALIVNAADYRRDWNADDPTAFQVDLRPGVSPVVAKRAVQQAIPPSVALHVQTATDRVQQYDTLAGAGLHRLTQISLLLLISAAIALAAATGAAIWQRRASFLDYRLQGYLPRQLWASLLIESGLILATGCAVGAAAGLYGHLLLGRWLRLTTGFPAPFEPSMLAAGATFVIVVGVALLAIAPWSYRAVKAPRTGMT
ncbi:MAG TPA: FtsX-like permease family protein [Conexibacter sp.]|jgi:putative ABC transport system permease protein|nr:FtsX-like permease family protein [Conexibacter sp.]